MAKLEQKKYPFPSQYGSHRSMVVEEGESHCICEDELGRYETEIWRLDNGLADPNRYEESRLKKLIGGKKRRKE